MTQGSTVIQVSVRPRVDNSGPHLEVSPGFVLEASDLRASGSGASTAFSHGATWWATLRAKREHTSKYCRQSRHLLRRPVLAPVQRLTGQGTGVPTGSERLALIRPQWVGYCPAVFGRREWKTGCAEFKPVTCRSSRRVCRRAFGCLLALAQARRKTPLNMFG